MRRRGMVGRPVARAVVGTAVVAGTAGAVHHHQEQKWAKKEQEQQYAQQQAYQQGAYEQQQAYEQQMAQQQYAPPPEPAPAAGADLTAQLQQLAQLHAAGVLSDEEFAAAKGKLLAG